MDARGLEPKEKIPASRKLGEKEAADLVRSAKRIVVAKGRKLTELEGGSAKKQIVAALLGPTGNLRAPALVAGKTLLVGFHDEAWSEVFD